ncbi:MAG: SpoIID/LytB domain-containing protein [Candidatus Omnitrophica bacterium]|nr:SpoIID/LytB domain-containing protein [Candidatus Omnitrophota bacterium]
MDEPPSTPDRPHYIRVVILEGQANVKLSVKGGYQLLALDTDEMLLEGKTIRRAACTAMPHGLILGRHTFSLSGFRIHPLGASPVYVNSKAYRGDMDIVRQADKTITVINRVDLEEYLKGVLRAEVSPWWPLEALKAQAVTARTFALYQQRQNGHKAYDVTANVASQLYGGMSMERRRTSRAVNETRGIVLMEGGVIFPAFYHACCGGHTEDASRLWNITAGPLKGVSCRFCGRSPYSFWHYKTTLQGIVRRLEESGYPVTGSRSIHTGPADDSGRLQELYLDTAQDKTVRIPAKNFREIMGDRGIKSTRFQIKVSGDTVFFEGRGWGHGVGLCQWGAFGMAQEGRTYEEILQHYYAGAELVRMEN